MKELIFTLSSSEYIKVIPDYDIDCEKVRHCCDNVKVYFIKGTEQLQIGQDSAGEILNNFIINLEKSLNDELLLHESLTEHLGLMSNEYYRKSFDILYDKSKFFMKNSLSGESSYWIGLDYKIWSTHYDANPYVDTWLYNDLHNNIILEITPFYIWSTREDEPDNLDFITYDAFIKKYTSLYRCIIPRNIAIKWLKKAKKWYGLFYKNEQIDTDSRRTKEIFYFETFKIKYEEYLINKYGGYKTKQNSIWYWDTKTQEWNIQTKDGSFCINSNGILSHGGVDDSSNFSHFTKIAKK